MVRSGYFRLLLLTSVFFRARLLAQTFTLQMCADPVETSTCTIVCHTPDLTKTIAFYKLPDSGSTIAQCIPSVGCFDSVPYNITQPSATTTALQFTLTRDITGPYRCSYGSNFTDETLDWGTFPEDVAISGLTNGTHITSPVEFSVKLRCLYSEDHPTVLLHYEDQDGDVDAKSDVFPCYDSQSQNCPHDDNLTTYDCPCKLRHRVGIDCEDEYGVNGYIQIANIDTLWNTSIADNITFKCTTTSPITTSPTTTTTTLTTPPNKCLNFIAAKSCVLTYIIFGVLVIFLLSSVGCLIKWKRNQRLKHHRNPSSQGHGKKKNNSDTQEMHAQNI